MKVSFEEILSLEGEILKLFSKEHPIFDLMKDIKLVNYHIDEEFRKEIFQIYKKVKGLLNQELLHYETYWIACNRISEEKILIVFLKNELLKLTHKSLQDKEKVHYFINKIKKLINKNTLKILLEVLNYEENDEKMN